MLEIQLFMSYPTVYESLLARSEGCEPKRCDPKTSQQRMLVSVMSI